MGNNEVDSGDGSATPFERRVQKATALQVDVAHLQNVSEYLGLLADGVGRNLMDQLTNAHRYATMGGEAKDGQGGAGQRSALGALGQGFDEADDLAKRELSTYTALHDSLRGIAQDIDAMSRAIADISEQYKTVEERNSAGVDAFMRGLGGVG